MTAITNPRAAAMQVHRIYVRAAPRAIWDAITTPEWSARYGYGGRVAFDLRPGGAFQVLSDEVLGAEDPEVQVDGEVIEADAPRRLVQTWRMLMDEHMAAEGFTRLSYDIEPTATGTRLTVTHELEHAPIVAQLVSGGMEAEGAGGGWTWVLSRPQVAAGDGRAHRPVAGGRRVVRAGRSTRAGGIANGASTGGSVPVAVRGRSRAQNVTRAGPQASVRRCALISRPTSHERAAAPNRDVVTAGWARRRAPARSPGAPARR